MINKNTVYFIGAGPGDPELVTVKARSIIEVADSILYTGSLVPKEVLKWAKPNAIIKSSAKMTYPDIFSFFDQHAKKGVFVRLHTGDPSIYSTMARQIEYLKENNIKYQVIPGVTAAFAAAASLGIEYTIPGVSQTLIISKVPGNTPNPEPLKHILNCKNSSVVLYLSITLIDKLQDVAINNCYYSPDTPCWVIEKASWPDEQIIKGTIGNIVDKLKNTNIKGIALILFGSFLNQSPSDLSVLYGHK